MTIPRTTLLLCLFWISLSNSLVIYVHNSTIRTTTPISLPFTYTTLGNPPNHKIATSNFVFLSHNNFTSCRFAYNTNTTLLRGSIIILESGPSWYACAYTRAGVAPAIGRVFQKYGVTGVVITAREAACKGCAMAFEANIHIPFIAVMADTMNFLVTNKAVISCVEFSAVSKEDASFLKFAKNCYYGGMDLIIALHAVSIALMSYSLYDEYVMFEKCVGKNFKRNWHTLSLKGLSICSSAVGIMYLSVDPFSFKGYSFWNEVFALNIYTDLYILVLMALLQLWIVTTENKASKIVQHKAFYYSAHGLAVALVIVGVIQGLLPTSDMLACLDSAVEAGVVCVTGIGTIFFGSNAVHILRNSGISSKPTTPLARKIIIFIILYTVINDLNALIWALAPLGSVYSLMLSFLCSCLQTLSTVIILFLPPIIQRKMQERRRACAIQLTSSSTPESSPTSTNERIESA